MPVKIYIGRDIQDYTQLPGFSHEARGIREIYTILWHKLRHYPNLYAVVANPQRTVTGLELKADAVLISQFGLGIIELKSIPGVIDCRNINGNWYADRKRIGAGVYQNPHEQVQDYMRQLRRDLINHNSTWLPGYPDEWEEFKFHTATCFTHPHAKVTDCQQAISKYWAGTGLEQWERFSVLSLAGVSAWATELRFEVNQGEAYGYTPYSWTTDEVIQVATKFFGAREWQELASLVASRQPYGYLTLREHSRRTKVYELYNENVVIGRDPHTCQVAVPNHYNSVSRRHACITHVNEGVFVEDLGSKHGTYLNGQRVKKRAQLQDGQVIQLCPPEARDKVCILEFSRWLYVPPPTM